MAKNKALARYKQEPTRHSMWGFYEVDLMTDEKIDGRVIVSHSEKTEAEKLAKKVLSLLNATDN